MWFCKIQYPFTKKGRLVKVPVFYEECLTIQLPAGLDLFITGGKSHASEINLARFLLNTLKPGQHFVDIGAHYGYFSLLAAKLVGNKGKVLAVEPSRSTFQLLHLNTVEHTTILALNQAVSNAKGALQFYEFPAQFSEYNTLQPNQYTNSAWFASNKPDTYYIATDYLDALLQAHQLLPAIVKIDVR
jgi:FkbM family methyltransferase